MQLFDAGLVGIEFIMGEGCLVQAVALPSESISLDEVWNRLQEEVEECTKRAQQAADEAPLGLETPPGTALGSPAEQPPPPSGAIQPSETRRQHSVGW